MEPLGAVDSSTKTTAPTGMRLQSYPPAGHPGRGTPATPHGQAMAAMERLAKQRLLPRFTYEWNDRPSQRSWRAGGQRPMFLLAVVSFLLVLARSTRA